MIAGTHSGVGKTSVATGIMAALRSRGLKVGAAKVGPDFIDAGYHALATGRPPRNLDAWICGPELMGPLAGRASDGTDVLVIEGVMGLFDDSIDPPSASTAALAVALQAPVVLVVDASAMSGSVAAVVHGFASFDMSVTVAGVVLNRVGSDTHEAMLRHALAPLGLPVLGVIRRDARSAWPERHLGLVPVNERTAAARRCLDRQAAIVEASCDLEGMLALARSAAPLRVPTPPEARSRGHCRIAVASGPAFSFYYSDNLELLAQAGAELIPFDPLVDTRLPPGAQGLYAGGGFPEVFGTELASNVELLADVRRRISGGLVTWAECGGLLWLARSLDGRPMAGVIPAEVRMTDTLTLGYRLARPTLDNPLSPAGISLRGHEFHYSAIEPPGDALEMAGRSVDGPDGRGSPPPGPTRAGFASPTLLAGYLHLHLGARPETAERFVATILGPNTGAPRRHQTTGASV